MSQIKFFFYISENIHLMYTYRYEKGINTAILMERKYNLELFSHSIGKPQFLFE